MRIINREIVAAIIISRDGKIFQGMKHLARGGVYSDCWHIPGGGVDEGETRKQALIREIKEELGLDISLYDIKLIDDEGNGESEKTIKDTGEKVMCKMNFYVFRVTIYDKDADDIDIVVGDDLEKYEWVQISDLQDRKLTPPSVDLFKRIGYIK